jgi:type I restriction enzyme S subunit
MEISKKAFRPIPVLVPDQKLLKEYGMIVDSTIRRIINNEEQAQILADLRDTLLPRLISGKLRLPEAEEMVANG